MRLFYESDKRHRPAILTPFSLIHFLNGLVYYLITVRILNINYTLSFVTWFIFHLAYEIKDFTYSYIQKDENNDYITNNSYINSISDQIVAILGFYVGIYLPVNIDIYKFILIIIFIILLHLYMYCHKLG
jgi:uncharacterized membrane protein